MTRLSTLLMALMIAVLLSSCADIRVIRYEETDRPLKPFDFPIAVLDKAKINRPYKVIGLIEIDTSTRKFTAEIIEQLRSEARKLGGDALIDLKQQPFENSIYIGSSYTNDLYYTAHLRDLWTAKVVVWQNPSP